MNLLREFNECRTDPKSYAEKIEKHLKYIKENNDPKQGALYLYLKEGGPKISLSEGEDKFLQCINYLNNIEPLPPLEYCKDLVVKVPRTVSKWAKKGIFADILGEKKIALAKKYKGYQFQFDIGWNDPEISAIMQIVDDNISFKGTRRKNILNKDLSLIGISSSRSGRKNCVYVLFANKSKN